MFMRLLNFKPAPYFFFTVKTREKKYTVFLKVRVGPHWWDAEMRQVGRNKRVKR